MIEKNISKRKLTNDFNISNARKSLTQNKIYQKLNNDNGIGLKTFFRIYEFTRFYRRKIV